MTEENSNCAVMEEAVDMEAGPSSHIDPTECLKLKPKRSILKSGSSFDAAAFADAVRGAHFDEANLEATLHPPGKDYGHDKIDEPKTPYHGYSDSEGEMDADRPRRVSLSEGPVDAAKLRQGLLDGKGPKVLEPGDEDEEETDERKERRKSFEAKRKTHYNEAQRMAEAKKLIAQELKELDTTT